MTRPSLSDIYSHFGMKEEVLSGVFTGQWKPVGQATDASARVSSFNPSNGQLMKKVQGGTAEDIHMALAKMQRVKTLWQSVPMPKRGLVLSGIRDALVQNKFMLGALISYEMGKVYTEGLGEVQEYIDMCEYAVGLSRSISGLVLPSERKDHMLIEQWNPLGTIGVISAFNFPLAVYGWNAALALVCGNTVLWKPAPSTSLIALALTQLQGKVLESQGLPAEICSLVCGDKEAGQALVKNSLVDLVSFTGSTEVGRWVGIETAKRFGKSLLECGGNNAVIIMPDADLQGALTSILFAAVGTSGQRCTTLRRLFIHKDIAAEFILLLRKAYNEKLHIGSAMHPDSIVGPVHSEAALHLFNDTLEQVLLEGGQVIFGGQVSDTFHHLLVKEDETLAGYYVVPAITTGLPRESTLWKQEKFVPILHIDTFETFEEAIMLNNSVGQGLSSSIFTNDPSLIFNWISHRGSDCGIVNVNIPTSGAEIGGAFGGNKETGGGREAGSDSWKSYMRRSTCTINYAPKGAKLQLAQGVSFD